MLEPLIWMFKAENFKKHFFILLKIEVILFILGLLLIGIAAPFRQENFAVILLITGILCFIASFLFLQGYFWELTECVIQRDIDVSANNLYDGKIKKIYTIKLPVMDWKKILWRGVASIVASLVLFLPLFFIFIGLSITAVETISLFNMTKDQIILMYKGLAVFICLFIPPLLYNYAARDSVFAVLNLPKAVYLIGNYTWQYTKNTFLFLLFTSVYAYIIKLITNIFSLNLSTSTLTSGHNVISVSAQNIILSGIIALLISFIFRIYFIFVNAYLLGTIAPEEEA